MQKNNKTAKPIIFGILTMLLLSVSALMTLTPQDIWADKEDKHEEMNNETSETQIKKPFPPVAGDKVTIKSTGTGDVRWILPGPRALDPKIFGTPDNPLGFEPDVGVPVSMRLTTPDGTAWTTTKMPTPFSNSFKQIIGEYKLKAIDATLFDDPDSKDMVKFKAEFTSPVNPLNLDPHTYKVKVSNVIPVGPDHPFMGGVGTNFVHHGMTGIGTKLMPTAPTFVAFWGIGSLEVDGEQVADNRLVHLMTTCKVRDANYNLVFDDMIDCTKVHTHLMMPNVAIIPDGPVMEPVPTQFNLPPSAPFAQQPFLHIMFENIQLDGVKTTLHNDND